MDSNKPDWAYERRSPDQPSALVVVVEGQTLLFTSGADVLSWSPSGWTRHDVQFPSARGDDQPQLNRVLLLPDRRLLIQLHPDILLLASLSDLLASRFVDERAPTFFTHLEVIDGRVYGLGWDESGNVRAVWARAHVGWSLVARLGHEADQSSMRGLIMLDDGTPVAVSTAGLLPTSQSSLLAGVESSIPLHAPGARQIPHASESVWVEQVFGAQRGQALLLLSGREAPAGIEIRGANATAFSCGSELPPLIGAFPHAGSWRLVDSDARPLDLPDAGCRSLPSIAR
jgi:hypothetical protein